MVQKRKNGLRSEVLVNGSVVANGTASQFDCLAKVCKNRMAGLNCKFVFCDSLDKGTVVFTK